MAARFFVTPIVVKQRLKLAAVAPALLDAYAEERMTLEQLMAFTVTHDRARQEQVWETLSKAYSREPYQIRRLLTEGAVRASDKRALFVGLEAYEAAGGVVMRDLFQHDDGGWLQDPALLDWSTQLPSEPAALWETLVGFDGDSRATLFAHCVSFGVNAVHEPWNRAPQRVAHADLLAEAVGLDMAAIGWTATVDSYLGRVPKARILEAVREAHGPEAAQLIDHLRKPDMAKEAERLLAGSCWLLEPLRRPLEPVVDGDAGAEGEVEGGDVSLPAFLTGSGEVPDAGDDADRTEAAAA
ncbi:putative plasmid stabilization protein [Azospirillum palustre]